VFALWVCNHYCVYLARLWDLQRKHFSRYPQTFVSANACFLISIFLIAVTGLIGFGIYNAVTSEKKKNRT
jgi:uncharacterized membrane protein (GlpM family)